MEQQIKSTTEVDIDDLWERYLERAANHGLSDEEMEEKHRQWEQEQLAMKDYWERCCKEEEEAWGQEEEILPPVQPAILVG